MKIQWRKILKNTLIVINLIVVFFGWYFFGLFLYIFYKLFIFNDAIDVIYVVLMLI